MICGVDDEWPSNNAIDATARPSPVCPATPRKLTARDDVTPRHRQKHLGNFAGSRSISRLDASPFSGSPHHCGLCAENR